MRTKLTDPEFSVLSALAGGPSDGPGILDEVARAARKVLRVATLYGVLDRLVHGGLVEADEQPGRRRYRLTGAGAGRRAEEAALRAPRPRQGRAYRLATAGGAA